MEIDYIFPRRILSSKQPFRGKILTEWKTALRNAIRNKAKTETGDVLEKLRLCLFIKIFRRKSKT